MSTSLNTIRAISFFTTTLFNKVSVEEVLWDITKNVIHKLGYEDCVIYLWDETLEKLVQKAAFGNKNPSGNTIHNAITLNLGEGIVGSAAESKTPILVIDTKMDSRYIIDDVNRNSEIAIPILINDKLFGVIDSEHSEVGFFQESDLHILTIIASICAQKIKDLRNNTPVKLTFENEYFQSLEALMKEDKLFLNPSISLESISEILGISSGYLSRLINEITGKNFATYVNTYRVNDLKTKLIAKEFQHYSLLSIGLECGFNSKAGFHRNFKLITGQTPSNYIKSLNN